MSDFNTISDNQCLYLNRTNKRNNLSKQRTDNNQSTKEERITDSDMNEQNVN